MYVTPAADWLTDYRQLRISGLAISDTWRRHRDTDSIPATLEPPTAQLKGAIVPQKLTVTYVVKTLPILNAIRKSNTVTFSTSPAPSLSNIFTTWYVTYSYFLVTKYLHQLIHHILPHFVTSYVRKALTMKIAISAGGRSVTTFRHNLPTAYSRQTTEL